MISTIDFNKSLCCTIIKHLSWLGILTLHISISPCIKQQGSGFIEKLSLWQVVHVAMKYIIQQMHRINGAFKYVSYIIHCVTYIIYIAIWNPEPPLQAVWLPNGPLQTKIITVKWNHISSMDWTIFTIYQVVKFTSVALYTPAVTTGPENPYSMLPRLWSLNMNTFRLEDRIRLLYITPSHYHHCASLSENIKLITCLSDIVCRVCE